MEEKGGSKVLLRTNARGWPAATWRLGSFRGTRGTRLLACDFSIPSMQLTAHGPDEEQDIATIQEESGPSEEQVGYCDLSDPRVMPPPHCSVSFVEASTTNQNIHSSLLCTEVEMVSFESFRMIVVSSERH